MASGCTHWPVAQATPRTRPQLALTFPVKLPAEYRWLFSGGAGPWQALGERSALAPPPNATGIEWRDVDEARGRWR